MSNFLRNVGVILPSTVVLAACSGSDSLGDSSSIASVSQKATFPSGSGCSSTQENTIYADEVVAGRYLAAIGDQALNILSNPTSNSNARVEQNFAPYSTEWFSIFNNFASIRANLSNTTYLCRTATDSDCTGAYSTAYARTEKGGSTVRLCPAYFDLDYVERARTLIHEGSHQNRNSDSGVGTDDGYTPSEYQFPSVHNAFGYQYYSDLCYNGYCYP